MNTVVEQVWNKAAKGVTFPATQMKNFAFSFPINVQ